MGTPESVWNSFRRRGARASVSASSPAVQDSRSDRIFWSSSRLYTGCSAADGAPGVVLLGFSGTLGFDSTAGFPAMATSSRSIRT